MTQTRKEKILSILQEAPISDQVVNFWNEEIVPTAQKQVKIILEDAQIQTDGDLPEIEFIPGFMLDLQTGKTLDHRGLTRPTIFGEEITKIQISAELIREVTIGALASHLDEIIDKSELPVAREASTLLSNDAITATIYCSTELALTGRPDPHALDNRIFNATLDEFKSKKIT